ncbi:UTRA domain-containing protein [Microbulbifer sp. ALW1]|uniref:UTRA domain-containing protein n=1 Tax=Microbulbifer sp. (strain ALW1) TaxID=1516059 RepID=UPI001F206C8D|nr:UTRA domain-containing protein [Microbulbifer sp. ALW1]
MSLAYDDIKTHISGLINSNRLAANDKLPSERELAEDLRLTRITLRDGLNRLEGEGLIYRQNRRGWFVAPQRFVMRPAHKVDFNQIAEQQGFLPSTQILQLRKQQQRKDIYQAFGLEKSTRFYALRRVRYLDGRAVMVEDSYMPLESYPQLDESDLSGSVTAVLKSRFSVSVSREFCNIQMGHLEEEYAAPLNIHTGALGLKILRLRYDQDDQLIDYNVEHWLPHAIEMEVTTR